MIQPLIAGVVGAAIAFASTFAIVLAGLTAMGATPAEAASGLLALCLVQGILAAVLSWRYRQPLSFAWSTPGAALLVAAHGSAASFQAAVGAFLVCGVLLLVTGLWPALGRLVGRIPSPLAGAMLAGILFPLCIAPVSAAVSLPAFAVPVIVVWLVLYRLAPRWAVPAALVVAVIGMAIASSGAPFDDRDGVLPALIPQVPVFDPLVIVSVALPLYIVTMASQNIPGFAILKTFGYSDVPTRPVLVGAGVASLLAAPFGGHAVNLVALSAGMTAGPDAHPDRSKRWVSSLSSAAVYIVLGLFAGAAAAFIRNAPPELIATVAGLALIGAFLTGVTAAFEEAPLRVPAAITFLVVASGVVIAGIGSAFWGLGAGLLVWGWLGVKRRG